ncbi:MAG: hypothetical protein K0S22_1290 [Oscillospiraceae bacterium]|jgi:hypothetical protein|nr:hypothetical protein [Oscillospiraceae bacterium]
MPQSWTSDIIAQLHNAKVNGLIIEHRQIAARIGWTPSYLSMVLNGKKMPKGAETKVRAALAEIIAERKNIQN